MENVDIEGIDYMWNEVFSWTKEQLRRCGKPYGKMRDIAEAKFLKPLQKPELVDVCGRSYEYIHFLMETVETYRNACTRLQSRLIENQQTLINVQKELSDCKSEKLEAMENVVKSSVATSVKEEFKSYSSVVSSSTPTAPTFCPEDLKTVVKTVVAEEDRSRNVLVFGLPEEDGEELETKISGVFEEIGLKPKLEAQRIGKKKTASSTRPVKVCVSSSLIVHQILVNAKNLRKSATYKTVFLSPDRSLEQREARKELIVSMRAKALEEPNKKFYIKDGQILSRDRED